MRNYATISLLIIVMALIGISIGNKTAYGCSCVVQGTEERLNNADVVFLGKVVNEQKKLVNSHVRQVTTFDVSVIWKGQLKPEINVWTLVSGGSCGYEYDLGEEYLVYAYISYNSTMSRACGYSWHISKATEELKTLGSGRPVRNICPQIRGSLPDAILIDALENPSRYSGWGLLADPGKPESPFNAWRVWLSLRNPGLAYGPNNSPMWKPSCP